MLLEDSPRSLAPVRVAEPHYAVFPECKDTSYAQRYALFCERLMRERLYDSACLLLSEPVAGLQGVYREPNAEIGFRSFLTSLTGRALAHARFSP
jgi:hypothetical protein